MPRPLPAQQKAVAHLRRLIRQRTNAQQHRLPVLNELAREAGVSPVTMIRALRRLRDEGLLSVSHGRGINVVTGAVADASLPLVNAASAPASPPRKWQRLCTSVEQDIAAGTYGPVAALPTLKELGHRYGVSQETMRKALADLLDRGVIKPQRRGYRLADWALGQRNDAVVLYAAGDLLGTIEYLTPRTRELLRCLQSECLRRRLRLEIRSFDYRTQTFAPPMDPLTGLTETESSASILGYVVWTSGFPLNRCGELAARLSIRSLPVAVLDESGEYVLPPVAARKPSVRLVSIAAGALHGERVGRYLRGLGHRRVAFISCFHGALWSRNRLDGLVNAFDSAGLTGAVAPLVVDDPGQPVPPARRARAIIRSMAALRSVSGSTDDPFAPAPTLTALGGLMNATLDQAAVHRCLAPLLARALESSGATAWVAANDEIAVACLAFLIRRKTTGISIVGFDDTSDALFARLTSYNFGEAAAVSTVVDHLLKAPGRGRTTPAYTEIEGVVVERESVRPLRA